MPATTRSFATSLKEVFHKQSPPSKASILAAPLPLQVVYRRGRGTTSFSKHRSTTRSCRHEKGHESWGGSNWVGANRRQPPLLGLLFGFWVLVQVRVWVHATCCVSANQWKPPLGLLFGFGFGFGFRVKVRFGFGLGLRVNGPIIIIIIIISLQRRPQ